MDANDPDHFVSQIPGLAKDFIQIARKRSDVELDFSEESIAKLDTVIQSWPKPNLREQPEVIKGLSSYLGEIIRRNIGGCWVDPRWKKPEATESQPYLSKVGGSTSIYPEQVVKKYMQSEGLDDWFSYFYEKLKHKAKIERRESTTCLDNENMIVMPQSMRQGVSRIAGPTFVISMFQFSVVIFGWAISYMLNRTFSGMHGWSFRIFLLRYGYSLAVIPLAWTLARVYIDRSEQGSEMLDRVSIIIGITLIVVIASMFGEIILEPVIRIRGHGKW